MVPPRREAPLKTGTSSRALTDEPAPLHLAGPDDPDGVVAGQVEVFLDTLARVALAVASRDLAKRGGK